eukprot:scaffold3396_cov176-Amphora_coffeaeformis.AAC.2
MEEHNKEDYDSYEEPLLVRVEPAEVVHDISANTSSASLREDRHKGTKHSTTTTTQNDTSSSSASPTLLASDRQLNGALWAGGIVGFVCLCGPVGALLGAWAAHATAKHDTGRIGKFARKVGDFTTRMGRAVQREWNEASASSNHNGDGTTNATTEHVAAAK